MEANEFSHLWKPLFSLWEEDLDSWLMEGYLKLFVLSHCSKLKRQFPSLVYFGEFTKLLYRKTIFCGKEDKMGDKRLGMQ